MLSGCWQISGLLRSKSSMTNCYGAGPAIRSELANDNSRIVIFADPVFDTKVASQSGSAEFRNWAQSLERLPNTAKEARTIARLYPDDRVTTYLGSQATSAILLAESTRNAAVLHIATHVYFNPETPDIVGIATASINTTGQAQRGFPSLSELLSQPFSSRLIVISGCETMLGRAYGGLGVLSLAQGFIAQGAGATLGTLWRVPDQATAEFMQVFYSALASERGNASRALFRARLKMMHSGKYNQPSFWADFALISSNRQFDRQVFE
jgi:CHAT domain-containing protein